MDLIWAGISSGPSTSCTQPASAGASRRSAVTRSVRTSGSAFSWMTSEAEVCRRNSSSTAVARLDFFEKARDVARDLEEAFAGRLDRKHRGRDRLDAARCEWGTNRRRTVRAPLSSCSRLVFAPARSPRRADATPGRRGPSCGRCRRRRRPQRTVAVARRRRLRHRAGRQRQAAREDILLQRARFRCAAARSRSRARRDPPAPPGRPSRRCAGCTPKLAGLRIEPQKTVRHFAEGVTAFAVVGRRIVGRGGQRANRCRAIKTTATTASADHDHLLCHGLTEQCGRAAAAALRTDATPPRGHCSGNRFALHNRACARCRPDAVHISRCFNALGSMGVS